MCVSPSLWPSRNTARSPAPRRPSHRPVEHLGPRARLEHELGTKFVDRGRPAHPRRDRGGRPSPAHPGRARRDPVRRRAPRHRAERRRPFRRHRHHRPLARSGLLDGLRVEHPRVRTVVVEASTTSLALQLQSGHLDLAVVNLPVDDLELATEPLFEEDLVSSRPPTTHWRSTIA